MGVLEHFWGAPSFRPRTIEEMVGIELARRLNDLERVREYVALISRTDVANVVNAFRMSGGDRDAFRHSIGMKRSMTSVPKHRTISVSLERRRAGLAVIEGLKPVYAQIRELSGYEEVALRSIEALVRWGVETYQPHTAVLSVPAPDEPSRAGRLRFAGKALLLELGVPVESTSTKILLESCGEPQCRSITEADSVIAQLFDLHELSPIVLRAVGVGTVCAVRRLFNDHVNETPLVA